MNSARLLVVDDEASLLQLMQRYLTRIGFDVEVCPSADEAWKTFERHPTGFGLVVVDLSMPGMSGLDLIHKLVGLNPQIRVLICSGYYFSVESVAANLVSQVGFLQKPFAPKMLAESITKLLDGVTP